MEAVSASSVAGWQTSLLVAYCHSKESGNDTHAFSELYTQLRKLCKEQNTQGLERLLNCRWSTEIEFTANGAELERTTIGGQDLNINPV